MNTNLIPRLAATALLACVTFSHGQDTESKTAEPAQPLPPVQPLFDTPMRDPHICLGPDGTYYLTGTTGDNAGKAGDKNSWHWVNEGIRVWKSNDLKDWEPLGLVWSLEKDATWARKFQRPDSPNRKRAVWAPEIHYLKGTFWLPYSMNYGGCGLLKSTTGKAEGPYVDVKKDGPITPLIDASLFEDDDGKVYWIYQNGMIARMNDDMSGLAEEPRLLVPTNAARVGFEGATMNKVHGKYILTCASLSGPQYHCMAAVADHIYGPYGGRHLEIPHGGHNMLFKTKEGQWMSTFFGSDPKAIFTERAAILPVEISPEGRIRPLMYTAAPPEQPAAPK